MPSSEIRCMFYHGFVYTPLRVLFPAHSSHLFILYTHETPYQFPHSSFSVLLTPPPGSAGTYPICSLDRSSVSGTFHAMPPKVRNRRTVSRGQNLPDPERESRRSGLPLSPTLVGSAAATNLWYCTVVVVLYPRWPYPAIQTARIRIGSKAAVYTSAVLEYITAKVLGAWRAHPSPLLSSMQLCIL